MWFSFGLREPGVFSNERERLERGLFYSKRRCPPSSHDGDETILGGGRYATDVAGYQAMVKFAKQFPERTWAIQGCNGIGKHIATQTATIRRRLPAGARGCDTAD